MQEIKSCFLFNIFYCKVRGLFQNFTILLFKFLHFEEIQTKFSGRKLHSCIQPRTYFGKEPIQKNYYYKWKTFLRVTFHCFCLPCFIYFLWYQEHLHLWTTHATNRCKVKAVRFTYSAIKYLCWPTFRNCWLLILVWVKCYQTIGWYRPGKKFTNFWGENKRYTKNNNLWARKPIHPLKNPA